METQPRIEPKPDRKTHNIFTSTLVRNQIPHSIEMMKMDTHHDLVLSNKQVHRYVTNILIASHSWIKLLVMFENNQVHELYETEIFETIRSLNLLERTILVQVEAKMFCLCYESGNLKTVAMVSLDFIRLRPEYQSFVRVDNLKKYVVIVAGQYLVIMLNQKAKDMDIFGELSVFEKAPVDVKWNNPDFNFFNDVYYVRILQPYFKDVIDVQIDKNNVYLLVREAGSHSIYAMTFQNLKPEDTSETIFKKKYQNLAPSYKLTVLSPETESSFLLFSQSMIYHLSANNQEPPLGQLALKENTDFSTLKTRLFNVSNVYYKDNEGVYVIKIVGRGKLERNVINNVPVKDFVMTTVSINGCLAYVRQDECILQSFGATRVMHRNLNSLLDLHIGRNILAVQYQGHKSLKEKKELNKVISIKRSFRPVGKTSANAKKTIIEKMAPFDNIWSMSDSKIIVVVSNGQVSMYSDGESLSKIEIPNFKEVFEIKVGGTLYIVVLSLGRLTQYDLQMKQVWAVDNISGTSFSKSEKVIAIEKDSEITLVNFQSKTVTKFNERLDEGVINFFICSQKHSFVKKGGESISNTERFLLYCCTSTTFYIYLLKPEISTMVASWRTSNVASGLAYLFNTVTRSTSNPNDLVEFKSVSDPHYVLTNLIPPKYEEYKSDATIVDFKYMELPSQTVLMFMTSGFECFLYRYLVSDNAIGGLYRRVVMPLYSVKTLEQKPFTEYTPNLVRFGSKVIYDDVVLEITQPFKNCFQMGGDVWIVCADGRLRVADLKGTAISGKLVHTVAENNSYLFIESTPQYYGLFTRETVEFYDKDLVLKNKISIKNSKSAGNFTEEILLGKMNQSQVAISSYQRFQLATQDFQSYKFNFSVYDIKDKTRTDSLRFEEPIVSIKFSTPGRIVFATSTIVNICEVKSNKIETLKTISHSQRSYLGSMAYWRPSKPSNIPHYLAFGGAADGLSFFGFDNQKLVYKEYWFQPLNFGVREIEILPYGKSLKAIIADNDKNIIILDLKQSGNQKIADFYLGTRVNKLIRVEDITKERELVYACCADGTIRVFTAIKMISDYSLKKFQRLMFQNLPTVGGLNHQFRRLKQQHRSYKVGCKGNIVQSYTLEILQSLSKQLRESIMTKSQFQEDEIQSLVYKNCVF